MSDKNSRRNQTTDALFDAILSLETREECYNFFEDLCTVKEISDMAQRLEAAKMIEFWYLRRCILRHDTLSIL